MSLCREVDTENPDARPLVRVIDSLTDEVGLMLMTNFGGRSRELALVLTKLEEARLWAVRHGERTGSHVVIDRREMLGTYGNKNTHEENGVTDDAHSIGSHPNGRAA